MHICDINNFYSQTGGGVKTYHKHKLAYFLSRPEHEYTLFEPDDHEAVEHLAPHVRVVHFPGIAVDANYRFMMDIHRMRRILRRFDPDLIEIGSPYVLPWVVRAAAQGLRAALTGFWHADYPRAYVARPLGQLSPALGRLGERAAWWYARQTYGKLKATFAAADCVVEGLWAERIPRVFQTPLGVDTARFDPKRRDPELRASVGVEGDRPLLFFPHRLLEEKGLSALLGAYPRIYAAHRPMLVIAGVGPGKPKLDAFMAQHPEGIHYLGYINDPGLMARWYASADATFALSAFETFGLSAAEAMASGCALIAADAGAVQELVTRARCGALVPYNDADALAERAIELLGSGELPAMRLRARQFAERHFDWSAAFDRMVGFYAEIVAAGDPETMAPEPRRWRT